MDELTLDCPEARETLLLGTTLTMLYILSYTINTGIHLHTLNTEVRSDQLFGLCQKTWKSLLLPWF